jgi:hypothetical protein
MTFARVRALIFVAVLFITAGVVVIMAIGKDSQTRISSANGCAPGLIPAKIEMPDRNLVTVNVYNGTRKAGLAEDVAYDFESRGFNVNPVDAAAYVPIYEEIALITYGPDAVGAGHLVSAYFLVNESEQVFDIDRKGAEVDVVVGNKFQQLATTTEVNQSIAAIGQPEAPEGTCAV